MAIPKPAGVLKDSLGFMPDVNFYTSQLPGDLTNALYNEDILNGWGDTATAAKTSRSTAAVPLYVSPVGIGWGEGALRAALGNAYNDYAIVKKIVSVGFTANEVASTIGVTVGSHPFGQFGPMLPSDWLLTYLRKLGFEAKYLGKDGFSYTAEDTNSPLQINQGTKFGAYIVNDSTAATIKYPIMRASAIPADECWIWAQDIRPDSYKAFGWSCYKFAREGALAGVKAIVAMTGDFNSYYTEVQKAAMLVGDPGSHVDYGSPYSAVVGATVLLDETLLTAGPRWVDYPLDPLGANTPVPAGGLRRMGLRKYTVFPLSGFPKGVSVFTAGSFDVAGALSASDLLLTSTGGARVVAWPATLLSTVAAAQGADTTAAGDSAAMAKLADQTVYSYVNDVERAGLDAAHRRTTIGLKAGENIDDQVFVEADESKGRPQLTFAQAGGKVRNMRYSVGHYLVDASVTRPHEGSVVVAGAGSSISVTVTEAGKVKYSGLVTDLSFDDKLTIVEIYARGGTFSDNSGSNMTTNGIMQLCCGNIVDTHLPEITDMLESVRDFDDTWLFRRHGNPFTLAEPQRAAFELMQFSNPKTALSHIVVSMVVYARAAAKRVKRVTAAIG